MEFWLVKETYCLYGAEFFGFCFGEVVEVQQEWDIELLRFIKRVEDFFFFLAHDGRIFR